MSGRLGPISENNIPSQEAVMSAGKKLKIENWKEDGNFPYRSEFALRNGQAFTRRDVFEAFLHSSEKGVIASILWGYPSGRMTRGSRGGIGAVLADPKPFALAVDRIRNFNELRSADALIEELNRLVPGISTSTTTKIAYFARLVAEQGPCTIYDRMVIRSIMNLGHPEFSGLKSALAGQHRNKHPESPLVAALRRQNKTYAAYLEGLTKIAAGLGQGVHPERLELYLFARENRGGRPQAEVEQDKRRREKKQLAND